MGLKRLSRTRKDSARGVREGKDSTEPLVRRRERMRERERGRRR